MYELEAPRQKRARQEHVVENEKFAQVVRPFLKGIGEWQRRLAFYKVRKAAASSTDDDRVQARLQLGELLEEVQRCRLAFEQAARGHQLRGRLADVRMALVRLTDQIRSELR